MAACKLETFEPDWDGHGLWCIFADGSLSLALVQKDSGLPVPRLHLDAKLVTQGCRLAAFPNGCFVAERSGRVSAYVLDVADAIKAKKLVKACCMVVENGRTPQVLSVAVCPQQPRTGNLRLALLYVSGAPDPVIYAAHWDVPTARGRPQTQVWQRWREAPILDGFLGADDGYTWLLCADGYLLVLDQQLRICKRFELPSAAPWDRMRPDTPSQRLVLGSATGSILCCSVMLTRSNSLDAHNVSDSMNGLELASRVICNRESGAGTLADTSTRLLNDFCGARGFVLAGFSDGTCELRSEAFDVELQGERAGAYWSWRQEPVQMLRVDRQQTRIWAWCPGAAILLCWNASCLSVVASHGARDGSSVAASRETTTMSAFESQRQRMPTDFVVSASKVVTASDWRRTSMHHTHETGSGADERSTPPMHTGSERERHDTRQLASAAEASPRSGCTLSPEPFQCLQELATILDTQRAAISTSLATLDRRLQQLEGAPRLQRHPRASTAADAAASAQQSEQLPGACCGPSDEYSLSWNAMALVIRDLRLTLTELRIQYEAQCQTVYRSIDALRSGNSIAGPNSVPVSGARSPTEALGQSESTVLQLERSLLLPLQQSRHLQHEHDELFQELLLENEALRNRMRELNEALETVAAANQALRREHAQQAQQLADIQAERCRLVQQLRSAVRAARFFSETRPERAESELREPICVVHGSTKTATSREDSFP